MAEQQDIEQYSHKAGLTTSTYKIINIKQFLKTQNLLNVPYNNLSKIIQPAFPKTFLLHNQDRKQTVLVNQIGERISTFHHNFVNIQIVYLTASQVLILESNGEQSKLCYWNLFQKTYTISETSDEVIFIGAFEKQKRVCWIKKSKGDMGAEQILKIEYFQIFPIYPTQGQQFILPVKLKQNENLTIKKLDNNSKFGIFQQTDLSGKVLQFKVFDISQPLDKVASNFCFNHNIYPNSKIHEITLADIWLIDGSTFYLRFQAELNQGKYMKEGKPDLSGSQHELQRQFDFIWNYKQNTVNLMNFGIPERFYQVQFANSLRKVNKICKIYYKNSKQKQFLMLPVYLIYIVGGEFLIDKKIQSYSSKVGKIYKASLYQIENRLIELEFQQNQLIVFDSTVNQFLFPPTQIYSHFMRNIIPECDDDLIYLAVHFLCHLH